MRRFVTWFTIQSVCSRHQLLKGLWTSASSILAVRLIFCMMYTRELCKHRFTG